MKTPFKDLSVGDRFRAVADAIEASRCTDTPHHQRDFVYECGTPSCVAGHAVAMYENFSIQAKVGEYDPEDDPSTAWEPVMNGKSLGWDTAGMQALGISSEPRVDHGTPLFSAYAPITPDLLRDLADDADAGADWVAA